MLICEVVIMTNDLFPVKLVIIAQNGDNTGLLKGEIHFHDSRMSFDLDGREINCPYESVERVNVDRFPAALSQYFDRGLVIQWENDGGRWRAVIEVLSGDAYDFLSSVCAPGLSDARLRVEQTVTPYNVTPDNDVETRLAEVPVVIDQQTKAIHFDAEEFQSIQPGVVTTVDQSSYRDGQSEYDAVTIQTLFQEKTVETSLSFSDDSYKLFHDYVVTASTLSKTGGPITVLLVDDEPGLTEVGKLQLTDTHDGLSIQCATSTEQALDLLDEHDYECLVTDYAMPEGGAPAIIERNKQREMPAKVIIYSRKDRESLPEDEVPLGIDLWITKKGEFEQYHRLGNAIKRLVTTRRNRKREAQ
jgi:CheY-like chemotaxis protein